MSTACFLTSLVADAFASARSNPENNSVDQVQKAVLNVIENARPHEFGMALALNDMNKKFPFNIGYQHNQKNEVELLFLTASGKTAQHINHLILNNPLPALEH